LFIAGIVITHFIANSYLFENINNTSSNSSHNSVLQNPGLLGDSAGVVNALFSALAFGGVIYTLFLQRGEIDSNQKDIAVGKFETKYYEMIHLHKQNVDEIKVGEIEGRSAIELLFKNLEDFYNLVENTITDVDHQLTLEKQAIILNPNSSMDEIARIEIIDKMKQYISNSNSLIKFTHEVSYGYFFYGIENYFITKDKRDIRFDLNVEITSLIRKNGIPPSLNTPRNSLLGHYFRHLYQTVQLVAKDKTINEEEIKYNYIKMLRAQLSDFEQALLYYNALSIMGAKWLEPLGERQIENMCYIARFRLIKNMPYYYNYFGIRPGVFFRIEKEVWESKGKYFFEINLA
jgi:hypothetical protein